MAAALAVPRQSQNGAQHLGPCVSFRLISLEGGYIGVTGDHIVEYHRGYHGGCVGDIGDCRGISWGLLREVLGV